MPDVYLQETFRLNCTRVLLAIFFLILFWKVNSELFMTSIFRVNLQGDKGRVFHGDHPLQQWGGDNQKREDRQARQSHDPGPAHTFYFPNRLTKGARRMGGGISNRDGTFPAPSSPWGLWHSRR